MTEKAKALQGLRTLVSRIVSEGVCKREFVCTPCGGHVLGESEFVSAWIITFNASPSTLIYVGQRRLPPDDVYTIIDGHARRLGGLQAQAVRKFEAAHLMPDRNLFRLAARHTFPQE